MKTYINLGCGHRYNPTWTNFDLVPQGPGVIRADLSRGIPLEDSSAEVVYLAAVLEHIRREHVPQFLGECFRVLRPGGIIRVAVPDLERLCRAYLFELDRAIAGKPQGADNYDWLMLEIFDQMVREKTGGEMKAYLSRGKIPNEEFVLNRIGEEGREIMAALRGNTKQPKQPLSFLRLLRISRRLLEAVRRGLGGLLLSARERDALRIGLFRLSGETHQWMYDRYSLALALQQAGFSEPLVKGVDSSMVPNWPSFGLDVGPDGKPLKPDLFHMEAIKKTYWG